MPTYIIISYDQKHIEELSAYFSFTSADSHLFTFNILEDLASDINFCLSKIIERHPEFVIIADIEKIESENREVDYNDLSCILSFLKNFIQQRDDSNNIKQRMLICSYFHEIEFIHQSLLSRHKLCLANYLPRIRPIKMEQSLRCIDTDIDWCLSKTIENQ